LRRERKLILLFAFAVEFAAVLPWLWLWPLLLP
jgi:hypothetical protein